MLEAFHDKTCLAKYSGNCLEMHFEYSQFSVAQKLTKLLIFGCQQLLIAVTLIAIAYYNKICLSKCVGNYLEMHFEYLHVSVAQKPSEL